MFDRTWIAYFSVSGADYTISTTVGQYHTHVVYLIIQVVPANYTISTIVGRYQIHIVHLIT
jgi:hypothetical protein